ncbi:MAG: hypothetical protein OXG15_10300 [Gammaproteobacteria bacterium]|nr:hypothetical protein [Gammaproteobacteria bacterium]
MLTATVASLSGRFAVHVRTNDATDLVGRVAKVAGPNFRVKISQVAVKTDYGFICHAKRIPAPRRSK